MENEWESEHDSVNIDVFSIKTNLAQKPMENIKQNWKNVQILFRFLVSFSGFVFLKGKRNPKQRPTENETIKQHQKSRRGRRKIAPAFYPPLFIYYRDINSGPETPPAFYMTAFYLI